MGETDPTGTQPGETPGEPKPTGDEGAPPAGDAPKPEDTPKTFTQEDVNRLVAAEKRDATAAGETRGREAATAENADDLAELATRRTAEKSEAEQRQEELDAEKLRADTAVAQAQTAERGRLRAEVIAVDGADLPTIFKATVDGDDEAKVKESVVGARAAWEELEASVVAKTLTAAASMTAEQLVEKYGEEATKALVGRLTGRAPSIASPAGGPAPQPAPSGNGDGFASLIADGKQSSAERSKIWLEKVTKPAPG